MPSLTLPDMKSEALVERGPLVGATQGVDSDIRARAFTPNKDAVLCVRTANSLLRTVPPELTKL